MFALMGFSNNILVIIITPIVQILIVFLNCEMKITCYDN